MNVEIKLIRDHGILDDERLVLNVLKDCNIGYYIVFDSTYSSDGELTNLVRHSYWFPDEKVSEGDIVVLYTKKGNQSTKRNKSGNSSHFFYQGMDKTIWNQEKDCAVILEINSWQSKGYSNN